MILRTLLFGALQKTLPTSWPIYSPLDGLLLYSLNGKEKLQLLILDELTSAFSNLLHLVGEGLKLMLVIDGLDTIWGLVPPSSAYCQEK